MWFALTLLFILLWYRSERCRATWRKGAIVWKENYDLAASDRDKWKKVAESWKENYESASDNRDHLRGFAKGIDDLRSMLRDIQDDESSGEGWKPEGWKPGG